MEKNLIATKGSGVPWLSVVRKAIAEFHGRPFVGANRSLRDRSNGSLSDHGHIGIHAHLRITFTDHLGITFIDDGGGEGGGMISTPAQQLQTSLLLYRITK